MGKKKIENFTAQIHDEGYYRNFDIRNLNHTNMIYTNNRESERAKDILRSRWRYGWYPVNCR